MSTINFDPKNPFPVLTYNDWSYQEAQEHSVLVDEWLGFKTAEVEAKLMSSQEYNVQADRNIPVQCWRGLPVQALQTPYSEIHWILSLLNLNETSTVVDLGCGYGRMAFVMGHHYPHAHFIGFELVAERVAEAQRVLQKFNYPQVQVSTQDLTDPDFVIPLADHYFIFDFGSAPAVDKTLEDLKKIARNKSISVIARGRYIRHRIYQSHPWLSSICEPKVYDTFTLFKS